MTAVRFQICLRTLQTTRDILFEILFWLNAAMFKNEALADFSIASVRESHKMALDSFAESIKHSAIIATPILNGKHIETKDSYLRKDPSETSITVSKIYMADEEMAKQALELASSAFKPWKDTNFKNRCECLRKAAKILRDKRLHLFALMLHEAGKPWKETDADICEAIDFLEYYACEMERLGDPFKTDSIPGEDNFYSYQPRGITVVISPWNFPLAITCGMAAAALVAGNPVIIKPSRQTSAIGYELCKIFLEAGIPESVITFLPGPGDIVGRLLVEDPRVSLYVFTGSKEVGLDIIERAAKVKEGQRHVKRVIAEMGGKNAIIVDEDADLDEAVKGIIYSAFGYSGQKCSACSRLIAVGSSYEVLLERLKLAVGDIITGKASDPGTLLGPVIDQGSQERILEVIAEAEKTQQLLAKGNQHAGGYYVSATVFRDVDLHSNLWKEEIFGPVLACVQAKTFEEAIKIANDCQYALTGGLYSRSPKNIQLAKDQIEVGNFYINRACTGAIVNRQPFGGFKLSGIGSKAGGRDYLLQFLEPRAISENTMRRGFAPE